MQTTLSVESRAHNDWIDITRDVQNWLSGLKVGTGVITVFVPHTTAGVTIQENADPPLKHDISQALERLFPWRGNYGHCEDNAAAHMKAVFTGASVSIPVADSRLALGRWQGVYLCEFDGPRRRQVVVTAHQ